MFKTIGIIRYWIYELDWAGLIAHWVVKLAMGMQLVRENEPISLSAKIGCANV